MPRETTAGDIAIGAAVDLGPSSKFVDLNGDLDQERLDGFELHVAGIDGRGEFPFGGPLAQPSEQELESILADYRDREAVLLAERLARPEDDIEVRRIDARGDEHQVDSQLLTLLKQASSLDYRIDFFGFDADCLRGKVTGTLRPFADGAPALCQSSPDGPG